MAIKSLIPYGLISAMAIGGIGCKNEDDLESKAKTPPVTKEINGERYKFEGNEVRQLSSDEDNEAKYGVISDAHGEIEKARAFANHFKEEGVDGIILPGDLPNNETLRYGQRNSISDRKEIKQILKTVAETGLPTFVIPGNHERKQDYKSAIEEITKEHDNIIDMTNYRVFDGDDADFISLPGYQTFKVPGRQFIPDDGYWAEPGFIEKTGRLREGLDDAVILISHGPGKTSTDGKKGPATIYSGEDVGDTNTTNMMKRNEIPFAISGHIHESGGIAATHYGERVRQDEWADQFTANFGGLEKWDHINEETYNGMAGTITIKGDKAKFNMIYLE